MLLHDHALAAVSVIHTASRPMANGPSVPSTEIMAKNIALGGHTHCLDEALFEPVADHFRAVGKAAGFLVDQHAEYDVFSIQHQIPGGMMGTFKAQLAMHKMMDKLPQVLDEVAAVRRDLGYPGMATPFSQLVGSAPDLCDFRSAIMITLRAKESAKGV